MKNCDIGKNNPDIFLRELKNISVRYIKDKEIEKAMAVVSACAQMLYIYNQQYTDSDLEYAILDVAENVKQHIGGLSKYSADDNTILVYDSFGLDMRGIAKNYLVGLKNAGYRIIYVTNSVAIGNMPETLKQMQDANMVCEYVDMRQGYLSWAKDLIDIILRYMPKAMFFYTMPYDVSGAVAFAVFDKKVTRFLIDLTDHAFWLGTKCNDFFLNGRKMGASNQHFERKICKQQLLKILIGMVVDVTDKHLGLPFDVTQEKYIFSGGSLYKTLGEGENLYYKIIDYILGKHGDIKFLYAGTGDRTQMDVILKKYPNRAFLIDERKDFYYLIENCVLYLNTYPMFGGMMMRYAAHAGRIPVTLRHEHDADGILLHQQDAHIEYDTYEELIADVDRLLDDEEYRKQREELLKGQVMTEEDFARNLRLAIEEHRTEYQHEFVHLDTTKFRKEYLERFDLKKAKEDIVTRNNFCLAPYMPWMYWVAAKKVLKKICSKVKQITV